MPPESDSCSGASAWLPFTAAQGITVPTGIFHPAIGSLQVRTIDLIILTAVLAKDRENELITTPARREVLREHFYRELTKSTYEAEARKVWADRLQRLLNGDVNADVEFGVFGKSGGVAGPIRG